MHRHAPRLLFCMMMAVLTFGPHGALAQGVNSLSGSALALYAGNPPTGTPPYMTILPYGAANAGYVGIGNTSPSYPLDVNGIARVVTYLISGNADFGPGNPLVTGGSTADAAILANGAGNILFATNGGAGNTERMRITSGGNVGIGMTNPTDVLQVTGGGAGAATIWGQNTSATGIGVMGFNGSTGVYGQLGAGSNAGYFNGPVLSTSSVTATAYYHSSDARLKTDIRPIEHALDKVLELKGVEFNWKSDGHPDMGMTAQNVSEVFPNVVHHDDKGMMSVEYDSMVGPMIEAIRELKLKNDHLESEIADLKKGIGARKDAQP